VTDIALAAPVSQPPATTLSEAEPPRRLPFTFEGRAGEYFRIWIVNLCLSIVTLGIYSAWATVRKKKYFYGNTSVDGANFDYHGDPRAILRGRVLAVGAFAVYTVVANFSPRTAAVLALAMLPAVPWLLLRSFRFNAVNSSYRHVRFGFHGEYRDMLKAVLPVCVFPLATLAFPQLKPDQDPGALEIAGSMLPALVFGALYPWMAARLRLIRFNGSTYGAAPFSCDVRVRSFYAIYFMATLVFVGGMFAVGSPVFLLGSLGMTVMIMLIGLAYLSAGSLSFAYTQSRVSNLVFNHTALAGGVRFRSDLPFLPLAKIYFTNLLAVVCTLGLAIPWAAVRTARFRAGHMQLEADAGLEAFAATATSHVGATGDEVGEVFGFDLAL
jgi:uncharacterized membrane protein YjgN (DUF898 family)